MMAAGFDISLEVWEILLAEFKRWSTVPGITSQG
jgi:hypothetical protein